MQHSGHTHRDPTTNRSFLPGFETPNEPTRMRPVSTFDDASTQTDLPALREDSERLNNGPSDAENSLLTQNKIHLYKAKKISQGKTSIVAESMEMNMPHQSGSHFTEI
jgi:hypothetical protein